MFVSIRPKFYDTTRVGPPEETARLTPQMDILLNINHLRTKNPDEIGVEEILNLLASGAGKQGRAIVYRRLRLDLATCKPARMKRSVDSDEITAARSPGLAAVTTATSGETPWPLIA